MKKTYVGANGVEVTTDHGEILHLGSHALHPLAVKALVGAGLLVEKKSPTVMVELPRHVVEAGAKGFGPLGGFSDTESACRAALEAEGS